MGSSLQSHRRGKVHEGHRALQRLAGAAFQGGIAECEKMRIRLRNTHKTKAKGHTKAYYTFDSEERKLVGNEPGYQWKMEKTGCR